MATATKAFGTLLKRETTPSSGTYTTLGGLTTCNWPVLTADMAETTDMEATSAHRTRIPTLNSLGDCTGELVYDSADATQEQMTADLIAQTVRQYQLVGSDTGAADWKFDAYVTSFAVVTERDGICTASFTLTPTGVVTRA